MYTSVASRRFGLGDAQEDFDNAPDLAATFGPASPWTLAIRAVRSVSVPMGILKQQVDAEMAQLLDNSQDTSDAQLATLVQDTTQLNSYAQQLPALIAAAKSLPEYTQDVQTANELNNWLAFLVDWATSTGQAVLQIPTDVANYAAQQIANIAAAAGNALNAGGRAALTGLAPWLIGAAVVALGAIELTKRAEGTRTGRALVRRV